MKILLINFCIFSGIILSLNSCKKEIQETSPILNGAISNPPDGLNCTFGDTITVSGSVSCDYPIQSLYLSLINTGYEIVVPGITIGENVGQSYTFSVSFHLDNNYAPSGNYFLRISAMSEGKNIFLSELKQIHVAEIPRTVLDHFCITGNSIQSSLYEFNDAGSTLISSYNFHFLDMKIDSRFDRIYLCAKENIVGLNSDDYTEKFQLSPFALNSDSFLTAELFTNYLYVGRNDGNIIAYNCDGQRKGETGENLFIRPLLTNSTDNYLYASILKGSDRKIAVYFLPSGQPRQELLIDFDLIGFNYLNESEQLVVGNRNGHTVIFKYLLNSNSLQLLKDIPATFSNSIYSADSGLVFLCTNSGIVRYIYSANATMTIHPDQFYGMNYDEINNIFYCFSGNKIKQLNGISYADLGDQSMPDSVMAISILYSK